MNLYGNDVEMSFLYLITDLLNFGVFFKSCDI